MEKQLENFVLINENNITFEKALSRIKEIVKSGKKVIFIGKKLPIKLSIELPKESIFSSFALDEYTSKLTMEHNNSSVLIIDEELVPSKSIPIMITLFSNSVFEGGRHAKRIKYVTGGLNDNSVR